MAKQVETPKRLIQDLNEYVLDDITVERGAVVFESQKIKYQKLYECDASGEPVKKNGKLTRRADYKDQMLAHTKHLKIHLKGVTGKELQSGFVSSFVISLQGADLRTTEKEILASKNVEIIAREFLDRPRAVKEVTADSLIEQVIKKKEAGKLSVDEIKRMKDALEGLM